ncbi:MAG: hypothetical protein GEU75_10445 [Dehalococcoidia bacterium]|nr:hypothetical protein [Dehalococcoidia bacterium]
MSIDLVAAALWLPLQPARKLVLIALCERANLQTGKCWPGRFEIAARASLSERRVSPHLAALERAGYLEKPKPGIRRLGETTVRTVVVKRILTEGEAARQAFLSRRQGLKDESSHEADLQGTFAATLGDENDGLGDVGGQQLTRRDADNRHNRLEPSEEPSHARASRSSASSDDVLSLRKHGSPA